MQSYCIVIVDKYYVNMYDAGFHTWLDLKILYF